MKFKFGRNPRQFHKDTLVLHDYLPKLLPPVPVAVTWSTKVPNYPMYLNDAEGDCVWAAGGHSVQTWTANANGLFTPADFDIQTGYESTGFIPGDPSTDNGTSITQMLAYWRDTGIAGHKIAGWAEFDPTNVNAVKYVIANFGLAFIGCVVRQSDMDNFNAGQPWVPGTDAVLGGHGIVAVDYDANGATIITWGAKQAVTWDWFVAEVDEIYAPVTQDFIDANTSTSPSGLDMEQLQEDLQLLPPAPQA